MSHWKWFSINWIDTPRWINVCIIRFDFFGFCWKYIPHNEVWSNGNSERFVHQCRHFKQKQNRCYHNTHCMFMTWHWTRAPNNAPLLSFDGWYNSCQFDNRRWVQLGYEHRLQYRWHRSQLLAGQFGNRMVLCIDNQSHLMTHAERYSLVIPVF